MTKSLEHKDSNVSLQHNHPGCMRSILHRFNHHRRHHVKKMLPHRRHASGKQAAADAHPGSSMDDAERPENSEAEMDKSATCQTEARVTEPGSVQKSSMTSRLKALISEEMSKRRGRHQRSSSHPARLQQAEVNPIHQNDSAAPDYTNQISTPGDENKVPSSVASLLDPVLSEVHKQPVNNSNACDICAAMLTMDYFRQSEVNEKGKRPVKDHTLLHDKSIYAIEPSKTASLQDSKLFLDALDLLNMRKELFLKVLKDPHSSLSHQFHGKQLSKLRVGLTKSVSFPMSGSSRGRLVRSNDEKCKQSRHFSNGDYKLQVGDEARNSSTPASAEELNEHSTTLAMCRENSTPEEFQRQPESPDIASPVAPHQLKSRPGNKQVIKRFKNIGEKIKHAIKESRKERKRIIMDAVLHKIPHGRKSTKESKGPTDTHEKPVEICNKNSPVRSRKSGLRDHRRTSSLNESSDRYNQLLEFDSRGEAKGQISERTMLRVVCASSPGRNSPRKLARILSLPDLRSNYGLQSEVSPGATSSDTPVKSGEQKHFELHASLDNQIQLNSVSEQKCQENFVDAGENYDDSGGLKLRKSASSHDHNTEHSASSHDHNTEHKLPSASVLEKPILSPAHDSKSQEGTTGLAENIPEELMPKDLLHNEDDSLPDQQHEFKADSPIKSKDTIQLEKEDAPFKQFNDESFQLQVDMKNKAEFDYIKDVLELSGFSRNEFLGEWHSAEQPLNPSVFAEVEGCLLAQPEFSENEVYGSCDHLLLFDIINEVLLNIYGKSSAYWPMPLTCCSHIHPMPVGYHVLEDVWADISYYLKWRPEFDQSLDDPVSRDLAKSDDWMNLQFDAECVGLELEELILDDLFEEVTTDLC